MSAVAARRFAQVDVFGAEPFRGNPVAVVVDADGVDDDAMAAFARWTNLSETTFLLRPIDPAADYRLRIFTPGGELPFAGHPTLGSAHAWLAAGGAPRSEGVLVQECAVGLVRLRLSEAGIAFAAPPRRRTGPVDESILERVAVALRIPRVEILDHEWVDNGPGWLAVRLASAEQVLALDPDQALLAGLAVGVVGEHPEGGECAIEVRAFVPDVGVPEDPVTGSLNAGIAQWLIGNGVLPERYTAAQGTVLGRSGRVLVERAGEDVWIGGATATLIDGTVAL
ncbi:PhzF family phenazine biosynthesis protein [Rathayibacter tanaceti]|uniref:PhzF family phenazine biosynthesis isomerase n=2 Tax=Rathayibacter tanaceti TaxID=1671680 RepID=A0A166IDB8_9MICO|nr:PhzF family phenazine biosynthesis protein [Rathayibacter tanaceti]KZX22193.1 Trans-2,3-dihydro-3-hydroxyanthranilate isomerase [Rathayibacter tanaceti]QHC55084.1 PhzF family phenazine biosynthesis isomerase [Rathayibacter tanaceti]TCO33822.1 PhzF family phenazine biosynthesis protein [Rathayibacter tanaceti]